jgi:hypothetical protein
MPAEERAPATGSQAAADVVLVAGFTDPVAADYAAYVSRHNRMAKASHRLDVTEDADFESALLTRPMPIVIDLSGPTASADLQRMFDRAAPSALVLFLKPCRKDRHRAMVGNVLARAAGARVKLAVIVSSFRLHLDDKNAAEAESYARDQAQALGMFTLVFRPGHVLSPNSMGSVRLRQLGFGYPLVPKWLRSCCIEGKELFSAIENERHQPPAARHRAFTLLGPNRPWKEFLQHHRGEAWWGMCLTLVSAALALLLVGQLAGLALKLLARRRPGLRHWDFDTLRPRSFRELLALYNKYNYRHVKVVGYNNGVIHFGQRYPGKTIVSTVHCNRVVRAGPEEIKVDCGATIHTARAFLAKDGQDLCVVPNYSYVCLGTAFFVPIHGSAAEFSTVAETITKVLLYDPVRDRFVVARRLEAGFGEYVYNLSADVLLLRLTVRVKQRARYRVECQGLRNPSSDVLAMALRDDRATNVEIRKSDAASDNVKVFKYYGGDETRSGLELPRDALGSLWDRLEENALTSFLMHALTRYFAWHVELFFTAAEFATFWQSHQAVPLRKIQLRYIRRDGFPHSPFYEHDCISVDMFMLRRHRRCFERYLKKTFAVVRSNPGKHSR